MIFGLDIGGTKCAVAKADDDGNIQETEQFPTSSPTASIDKICAIVDKFKPAGAPRFGISCGGPLDAAKGIILSPPNLPGWDEIPIVKIMEERFGGCAHLMNDANAGALAEWQFGAGRGCKSMLFLTHGTGMGAGLILDGRLYEGASGDAGEVGHIRMAPDGPIGYGKPGSFEGFCSGTGIARLAAGRIPGMPKPTAREVAMFADNGCPEAIAVMDESGRWLGRALAILIDILNPEAIVLGSIYTRSGHFLRKAMEAELAKEALPSALAACKILPAQLGEKTGVAAAIAIARYFG